jgi:transcriptional regulator with XRE-family HTH domain
VAGARNGKEQYRGTEGMRRFAAELGKAYWTVRGYEAGRSDIPRDVLLRIAQLTGRPVEWLLGAAPDEDAPDRSAVTIAGVAVTGPADKLAEILAGMAARTALSDADTIALSAPEMQEPKARPSERHTGLHVLLDAVDAGEFERRYGFPLTPNDELGLRTYGRSGPAVTTEAEALGLVARWQTPQPDPEEQPEPGIVALLQDRPRVEALGITEEEEATLLQLRWQARCQTADDAALLLTFARATERAVRARLEKDTA